MNYLHMKYLSKENHHDRFLYFIYWKYEEVRKIFHTNWNDIHDLSDFSKLRDLVHKINNELILQGIRKNDKEIQEMFNQNCLDTETQTQGQKKPCKKHKFIGALGTNYTLTTYKPCFYYINCSFDGCKEMNALYNYFKDCSNIKSKISSFSIKKGKQYYKYLTYVGDLYKPHRKECCDEHFDWNDWVVILNVKMNIIQIVSCLFVKQPTITFKCTQKGDPLHSISYKLECKDTNSSEDYKNKLGFNIKKLQRLSFDFSYPIHVVILITTGTFGMLFFSLILYKFTPFGSFRNRGVFREENIKDYNNDGYEIELFGNNYEYENIKSQSRRVHVAYHPV
ncbi:PIR Superfamily Protein [Plasmodium ovale curtisi]|uniref:PIR Superfamily Protein n=1 Tax=Plasmodium ovale curtisi TaxID=864141 RepID=A0A1A8WHT4_PLAOA|nr:PIR Superfamily Protein [Plasmodium ovale curtisi]